MNRSVFFKVLLLGGWIFAPLTAALALNSGTEPAIHKTCIDEPISMIDVADANKSYYYHFDRLGSVIALTDQNADLLETYSYDVFGQPSITDSNHQPLTTSDYDNPYMFTARRHDPETGLYYYRARYYDTYTGRFLQPDPIHYYNLSLIHI